MIDVKQLCYSIQDTPILKNITFSVPSSSVFHIHADNGAGKTTLLQLLCGLRQPEYGEIFFNNQSIHDQLNQYQQQLNYIGHQTPLQNQLTIAEHWLLSNIDNDVYRQAVDTFQLSHCDKIPAIQLSAGQRKKAVLMGLLLYPRPIWILDEPFVSLDQKSMDTFLNMIEHHVANGGMTILTSHQSLPLLSCQIMSLKL